MIGAPEKSLGASPLTGHTRFCPLRAGPSSDQHTSWTTEDMHQWEECQLVARLQDLIHRAPNTLTLVDQNEHASKRRILSQGLSASAILRFEETIVRHFETFCAQLSPGETASKWSAPRDMSDWCNSCRPNFPGESQTDRDRQPLNLRSHVVGCFYLDYNALTDPAHRKVTDGIEKFNVCIGVLTQAAELGICRMDRKLFPESIAAEKWFGQRVKMKATEGPPNVFSFLLKTKDPETGSSLSPDEIGAESTTLLVAGSDTSSTAMASLFFYLAANPACYARACAEMRAEFSIADALRACADEAMRISLPAGRALWHEVLPGRLQIDGHFIPARYHVGVGIYALHHSDKLYGQPFDFIHERWLRDESGEGGVARARSAFNPRLALQEIMLMMAIIAEGQDVRLGAGGSPGDVFGRHRNTEFRL
ncbi:cytochrome P450 [Macrophomina phaseolina]|uniref:Cytochrome P450 n=1 Tax=Macrophomina phaseolina TaxID=35725 RepID=A0ABQ8GEP3_9PEZI|nr:cytochrome P450 [Macrophomina phaseolina]